MEGVFAFGDHLLQQPVKTETFIATRILPQDQWVTQLRVTQLNLDETPLARVPVQIQSACTGQKSVT